MFSILIPARNEAPTIGPLVAELARLEKIKEVVVVDDGSADATAQEAQKSGARVLSHDVPSGNGAAVKTGLKHTSSEFVIIIDADGQHGVEDVHKLMAFPVETDLVVGARPFSWFRFRDFGNLILSTTASLLCGKKIPDLTSGLRRIRRSKALLFYDLYPQGFSFPSTSTIMFVTSLFSVAYLPIENRPRPAHASRSKLRPLRDGFKFLSIIYRIIMMSYPLRFFVPIGTLCLGFGIIWVTHTIISASAASAGGVLFVLSGLTLLLFGAIADQLSHIRRSIGALKERS
jgi:glycosyltransferase involved in cell wall biosynthesis